MKFNSSFDQRTFAVTFKARTLTILFLSLFIAIMTFSTTIANSTSFNSEISQIDTLLLSISTDFGRQRELNLQEEFFQDIMKINEDRSVKVVRWTTDHNLKLTDKSSAVIQILLKETCDQSYCGVGIFSKGYWGGGTLLLNTCQRVILYNKQKIIQRDQHVARSVAQILISCMVDQINTVKN
ncbi:hypothetical protein GFK91_29660 (plasmid) [Roseibium aggregatum]|uniref:hypothetical protein n=1 Tax=Roseibium aggregatum TaxID=187304 RepID=UPI001E3DAE02|nr:hypothetical protein [Roseibium aggregatum]UES59918.1 hypothetical protein GFK91_29660 [Roseibium aggregatum]